MGKRRTQEEEEDVVEVKRRVRGGLSLPSQLDRNHSLQRYPAETFDMEIHDCANIWT